MDIILLPGLWLPVSIWTVVVDELAGLGHRAVPISLPGVDDGSRTATLEEQLVAVLAAVDDADRPLVVGHSAASTLAWLAADRRAEAVSGVVMVGGFPSSAGAVYADFFPVVDGEMAFPGWEPFDGPDSDDLDAAARDALASIAVAVPAGVAEATVAYADERRFLVPVVLVCPEYTPEQAASWIEGGDLPELARVERLSYADIDSGHWPMVSRPVELARLLHEVASGLPG
jgi:pimeloyl-ACP methyl ester carboxylesterase